MRRAALRFGGCACNAPSDADVPDASAPEFPASGHGDHGHPLGMIGVVGILLIVQKPLGFVAILGVLALFGMIAKNGVILIAQIEKNGRRERTCGWRWSGRRYRASVR